MKNKVVLAMLIVVVMTLTIIPMGSLLSASAAAGDGSEGNPYQISSAVALANLAARVNSGTEPIEKYYRLMGDIDLTEYGAAYNSGKGWVPIGTEEKPFKGHFDGNGKKITGLYINRKEDYTGLFGRTDSATIKALGVEDADITGGISTGSVAGYMGNAGGIANCYATGIVTGTQRIGGLVGNVYLPYVLECYTTSAVSGERMVGGLVGWVRGNPITNCYTTGAVTASGDSAGGVVGFVAYTGLVNCYAIGAVSAGDGGGGVVGGATNASITDCAALNPSVTGAAEGAIQFGRVAGRLNGTENIFSGNVAFSGMGTAGGASFGVIANLATDKNGHSKNAEALQTISGFPLGFDVAPWVYTPGGLPSFAGKPVPMPVHLGGSAHPRGDVTLDGIVDIDDILAVRAHMFGTMDLTGEKLTQALDLCAGEPKTIDIDVILAIRGILFGN